MKPPILVSAAWERGAGLQLVGEEAVGEGTPGGPEEQPGSMPLEGGLRGGLGTPPAPQEVRQGRVPWLWPRRAGGEMERLTEAELQWTGA